MRLFLSFMLIAALETTGAFASCPSALVHGPSNQSALSEGPQRPPTRTRDKQRPLVIVILGSSTAAGTGAKPIDSAWVWRLTAYVLSHDSSATVINLAVGGYTTYDIMPTGFTPPPGRPKPKDGHNISKALSFHPDILIVNLPSNDAANEYPVREQLSNYAVLVGQITNPTVQLFVSTTQPRNFTKPEQLRIQMDMRDSTYLRFGSHTMDFWTGIANPDASLKGEFDSGDGIHLNNLGHRILFERALHVLKREVPVPKGLNCQLGMAGGTTMILHRVPDGSRELILH